MRYLLASRIMPRTTINLDADVLRALKRRKRREGKSLGTIVSEMLASALSGDGEQEQRPVNWITRPMHARVDLEDKEAVRRALEEA